MARIGRWVLAALLAVGAATLQAGVIEDLTARAESGDADAQWLLGDRYQRGIDVEQDYTAAAEWYRKASGQGHAAAQYRLGLLYLTGQGVEPDRVRAETLLREAAIAGFPGAPMALASFYLGMGAPEETDFVKAYAWLLVAANRGLVSGGDAMGMRDLLESELTDEERAQAEALATELLGGG